MQQQCLNQCIKSSLHFLKRFCLSFMWRSSISHIVFRTQYVPRTCHGTTSTNIFFRNLIGPLWVLFYKVAAIRKLSVLFTQSSKDNKLGLHLASQFPDSFSFHFLCFSTTPARLNWGTAGWVPTWVTSSWSTCARHCMRCCRMVWRPTCWTSSSASGGVSPGAWWRPPHSWVRTLVYIFPVLCQTGMTRFDQKLFTFMHLLSFIETFTETDKLIS